MGQTMDGLPGTAGESLRHRLASCTGHGRAYDDDDDVGNERFSTTMP